MAEVHESQTITQLKSWLQESGGGFHANVGFMADQFGLSVIAVQDIPADETIVSIPFSLAITPEVARAALQSIRQSCNISLNYDDFTNNLAGWSERQLICTYICLHWIEELRYALSPGV
jgi:hypothetical protein